MKRLFFLVIVCVLFQWQANAAIVDTIVVHSAKMNKDIKNVVIRPGNYDCKKSWHFPVLYLLHGAGGCYSNWINKVPLLPEYADLYGMMIVCPDGGKTSWYIDSPVDSNYKYETYIVKELVPYIDENYKTIINKSGRAIAGLSMGGHGAFYLAIRHQDIWGAAGSMSGLFNLSLFSDRWDLTLRIGGTPTTSDNWSKNSVENLVYLLKGSSLELVFECGKSDVFYDSNIKFHELLKAMSFKHDFTERMGDHSWEFWPNSLKYQMLYFYYFFSKKNVLKPSCK